MILWQKAKTGTLHAYEMPLKPSGESVTSMCGKIEGEVYRYFVSQPPSDKGLCRLCRRKQKAKPRASGGIDL